MFRLNDLLCEVGSSPIGLTLEARIKLRLSRLRRILLMRLIDSHAPGRPDVWKLFRAWRSGFSTSSYDLYGLAEGDSSEYLSLAAPMDDAVLWPQRRSINDKLLFYRFLDSLGLPHPTVLAYVRNGRFLIEGPSERASDPSKWLDESVRVGDRIVLKPDVGLGGRGLVFLDRVDEGLLLNGRNQPRAVVERLLGEMNEYLVTEFVLQGEYSSRIYAATQNTARILTLWDYESGQPFVAAAAHRFGTSRCHGIDNFHHGQPVEII